MTAPEAEDIRDLRNRRLALMIAAMHGAKDPHGAPSLQPKHQYTQDDIDEIIDELAEAALDSLPELRAALQPGREPNAVTEQAGQVDRGLARVLCENEAPEGRPGAEVSGDVRLVPTAPVLPTSVEETVELMARAICKVRGYDPDGETHGVDQPTITWMLFLPDARAALSVLPPAGNDSWKRLGNEVCVHCGEPITRAQTIVRKFYHLDCSTAGNDSWNSAIEAAAKVADEWADEHRIETQRERFTKDQVQHHVAAATRFVAEDIRSLSRPSPEKCEGKT
jgi:hypothetical protein